MRENEIKGAFKIYPYGNYVTCFPVVQRFSGQICGLRYYKLKLGLYRIPSRVWSSEIVIGDIVHIHTCCKYRWTKCNICIYANVSRNHV